MSLTNHEILGKSLTLPYPGFKKVFHKYALNEQKHFNSVEDSREVDKQHHIFSYEPVSQGYGKKKTAAS